MEGKLIRITDKDNVAVALAQIAEGESVSAGGVSFRARRDIPQGHKIAVQSIREGEPVVKYGTPIGHATAEIPAGGWVHTHNMATNLSGEEEYRYEPAIDGSWDRWLAGRGKGTGAGSGDLPGTADTFSGFRRPDGRAGIRNEIWIIPTVGCVNDIARKLAAEYVPVNHIPGDHDSASSGSGSGIDGVYAFEHPYGCSQTGADHAQTRKLLAALARHPNAGGVLIVSLGCENCTHEQFTEELGDYDPERVKFLICQQEEDEIAAGKELLRQLEEYAGSFRREEIPLSELVVGFKCGGSDGLSGITANPLVGRFGDLLIRQGGSAVLTEVPEMFGAEEMLLPRCVSAEVFEKAAGMLNGFKEYFLSHGEVVYENPSPGNKAGGITTLEDKSCGCVQKGGTAPVTDVIGYGDTVKEKGLTLLCGPGNDLVSSTALAAAGAHLILFTTGRGTPFGAPVPTLKIATNTALAKRKKNWIDFNAGVIADGDPGSAADAAAQLMALVTRTASGEETKSEKNGYRGIAVWKDGVTL